MKGLKETSSGRTSFIKSMMKMSQIIRIDFKKIGKQIQGKLKLGFPLRYLIGLYDMTQLPLLPSEEFFCPHKFRGDYAEDGGNHNTYYKPT